MQTHQIQEMRERGDKDGARVTDSMILLWSGSETTAGGMGLGENLRNLHLEVVSFI